MKTVKAFQAQNWKEEIRASLRARDLHVVAYETYLHKHRSFFWNRFMRGEQPAAVALEFAAHVGAI